MLEMPGGPFWDAVSPSQSGRWPGNREREMWGQHSCGQAQPYERAQEGCLKTAEIQSKLAPVSWNPSKGALSSHSSS